MCLKDLSSSIWLWHRDGDKWAVKKVIDIPAEPAAAEQLPPAIQAFKACPPLVTDIDLSVDDKYLYVSCWGTGDLQQYDVSDPFKPEADRQGPDRRHRRPGRRTRAGKGPLNGGPQMVEVSRDGKRDLLHQLALRRIDAQFYPDGVKGWMVKLDAKPGGGIELDRKFFLEWPDGYRPHQVRLQGGDASSDSYCYP